MPVSSVGVLKRIKLACLFIATHEKLPAVLSKGW